MIGQIDGWERPQPTARHRYIRLPAIRTTISSRCHRVHSYPILRFGFPKTHSRLAAAEPKQTERANSDSQSSLWEDRW